MSYAHAMPEPETVWPWHYKDADRWFFSSIRPEVADGMTNTPARHWEPPQTVIPGIMGLDELYAKGFQIEPIPELLPALVWRVLIEGRTSGQTNPSALEAQWEATCLARKIYP